MDIERIFWITLIFMAFAAIPLAIFRFTVNMTTPGKSLLKFFIDFVFFWLVIAIALQVLGLPTPLAVPAAFAVAFVRHKKRPEKTLSDNAAEQAPLAVATETSTDSVPR